MDIMSAYWRYHTPKGGDPIPLFPVKRFRQPVWTGGCDYPPPGQRVASIDRTIVVLPNGKERRFMPTDFSGRQKRAITATNAEAGLYNLAAHRTGNTSVCPASVCNFYRIDGPYSFILIQGNPVSYAGIPTILCIQFPLVQPHTGGEETLRTSYSPQRATKDLS